MFRHEEEYGHYLVDELEEPELSDEVKRYFMYEEYGRDASINDPSGKARHKGSVRLLHGDKDGVSEAVIMEF